MHIFSYFPFLYLFPVVTAQSPLLPPKATANLTKDRPYQERVSLAKAAMDIALNVAGADANGTVTFHDILQTTPIMYSQMAEFDSITQATNYRDLLKTQLPRASTQVFTSQHISDYLLHGYAASKAYVAYKDDQFLALAQQFWEFGREYWISDDDVGTKKNSMKSPSLRTECDGKSLVGGVFQTTNSSNGAIEDRATSFFFTLSAVLAELTSNVTYTQAADQTLQFLKSFAYVPRSNDPSDEQIIGALDTDPPCHTNSWVQWYPTTGDIIEGLSILLSMQEDTALQDLLQDAVNSSTLDRNHQEPDGVIHMTGLPLTYPAGDPYLVRGLATAYRRNHIDPNMREYIKGFIDIQYNYLLDNATQNASSIYVDPASGPPDRKPQGSLNAVNQTHAVMVFVQAITNSGNASSNNPGGPTPSGTSSPEKKAAKIGAIVGGVVGALALIALLLGLVILCRRRRRREPQIPSMFQTTPFELPDKSKMEGNSLTSPTYVTSPIHVKPRLQPRYSAHTNSTTLVSPISSASPISPTSTTSPLSPRVRVKTRPNPPPPRETEPSVTSPTTVQESIHSDVDSGPANEDPHARFHAMSTAEMARILNARLQAETLDNDMPPSYPQSQIGG